MDTLNPRLEIGGNNPPDTIELMLTSLRETHGPLVERSNTLSDMSKRLPAACEDGDTAGKLADAIKSCTAFTKNADAARISAKEPHLAAGRAVDGFFKKLADPVEALKVRMSTLLTAFQRAEADKERRRLQAIADEERRVALEAERAAREAARIAREAREAEEQRAADARAAAEALAGKARAEALAAEEERAAKARAAAKATEETAAAEARDAARSARADANVAKEAAQVKGAELSRARTDLGVVASLRTTWAFEIEDAAKVPRPYLSVSEGAIKAAIKAATTKEGKCTLKIDGVRIYEKQETVVR